MKLYCDLHIHTVHSDGLLTVSEVIKKARENGLHIISITDHDTVGGVGIALEISKVEGIMVIPGIEISAESKDFGEVHVLGYFINWKHKNFVRYFEYSYESRLERIYKIVKRLNDLGIRIDFSEILNEFKKDGNSNLGRPHIAQILVKKGYVKDCDEAFDNYLGKGRPAYVEREKISVEDAISLITNAGGIPVIAHPGGKLSLDYIIYLKRKGLMGVEVWYPKHTEKDVEDLLDLCNRENLIPTGGSDFHGWGKRNQFLSIDWDKIGFSRLK